MTTLSFTDAKGITRDLVIDAIEDIFGFNSASGDAGEQWYYWVSMKSGDVFKSVPFSTLDEARESYSALKLSYERALAASA